MDSAIKECVNIIKLATMIANNLASEGDKSVINIDWRQ